MKSEWACDWALRQPLLCLAYLLLASRQFVYVLLHGRQAASNRIQLILDFTDIRSCHGRSRWSSLNRLLSLRPICEGSLEYTAQTV